MSFLEWCMSLPDIGNVKFSTNDFCLHLRNDEFAVVGEEEVFLNPLMFQLIDGKGAAQICFVLRQSRKIDYNA